MLAADRVKPGICRERPSRRPAAGAVAAPSQDDHHRQADNGAMDEGVRDYIDRIDPAQRPLFERIHRLIITSVPQAEIGLSYRMPAYRAGGRRLYLGVWRHGVSLYGWPQGGDGGFVTRHPGLLSGKATIRIRPQDAALLSDAELSGLIRATLTA
jgi:hypothetical protein